MVELEWGRLLDGNRHTVNAVPIERSDTAFTVLEPVVFVGPEQQQHVTFGQ